MKTLPVLFLAAALVPAVLGAEEDRPTASPILTRRLASFPPGAYTVDQAWDEKVRNTLEVAGEMKQEKASRLWNRFTYDLDVSAPAEGDGTGAEARITVRRIRIGVEGDRNLQYDSDGKPEEQAEILHRQFRYLAGARASVTLAAFDEGKGFEGLGAAWARFAEENPGHDRMAENNRQNFGDTRLDKLFACGLPVLFGPEAGRAAGRTRTLTAGETFDVDLEILGLAREPSTAKHSVRVESVDGDRATLVATWHENGFRNKVDGETVIIRGGDIKGRSEMTFHLPSGLLVSLTETETRADQSCGMDMVQRTRYGTTLSEIRIVPR